MKTRDSGIVFCGLFIHILSGLMPVFSSKLEALQGREGVTFVHHESQAPKRLRVAYWFN